MTATKSSEQTSFVFLRGTLLKTPRLRQEGRSATLLVAQGKNRTQVKVRGPARVEAVRGWQAGDRVVAMGNLESHFDTRTKSHLLYVRAIVLLRQEAEERVDWDEFGLPAMLGQIYRKLAEEETEAA